MPGMPILLEDLALGSTGVSDNTNINIPSEVCFLCCNFRNSTKQHKEHSTFDFIISWKKKKIIYNQLAQNAKQIINY